jgi:hypothetical protein
LVRACCRPPAYHEPTVRSGRLHTTAFLVSPGYGICRLQISGQIPWFRWRLCASVPLDRSRTVRALRGGRCQRRTIRMRQSRRRRCRRAGCSAAVHRVPQSHQALHTGEMRFYLQRPFRTWPKWPRGQSCVLAEPCVARATSSPKRLNLSQARSYGPSSASAPSRSGAGGMTRKKASRSKGHQRQALFCPRRCYGLAR